MSLSANSTTSAPANSNSENNDSFSPEPGFCGTSPYIANPGFSGALHVCCFCHSKTEFNELEAISEEDDDEDDDDENDGDDNEDDKKARKNPDDMNLRCWCGHRLSRDLEDCSCMIDLLSWKCWACDQANRYDRAMLTGEISIVGSTEDCENCGYRRDGSCVWVWGRTSELMEQVKYLVETGDEMDVYD